MKIQTIFTLLTIVYYSNVFAEIPDHGDVCYRQTCSAPQLLIWDQYRDNESPKEEEMPGLYSGSCFHKAYHYNGDHVHHGVILIDKKDQELYFGGRFSFFANTNPYASWDLNTARQQLSKNLYDETHKIKMGENSWFVDLNPGSTPLILYWIKRDPLANKITVIGMWGISHTLFCDLESH